MSQPPLLKRAHTITKERGWTRDDRIQFAAYLLRRDIGSWVELDDAELHRMNDALDGLVLGEALEAQ